MRIGVLPADGLVLAEEATIRRGEVALRSEEVHKSLLREEDRQPRTA